MATNPFHRLSAFAHVLVDAVRTPGRQAGDAGKAARAGIDPQLRNAKLAALRALRAEVQDLQALLANVRQGKTLLAACGSYLEQNTDEVQALFERILENPQDESVIPSDKVRHLINLWQQLLCTSIFSGRHIEVTSTTQLKELVTCEELCADMVAEIGTLTIPARLNEMLANAWTGYLLSFDVLFADEMPRASDRKQLLSLLASSPGLVRGGIVDPESGLIFPYHKSPWVRMAVCFALFLGVAAISGAIYWLGQHYAIQTTATGITLIPQPDAAKTVGQVTEVSVLNWFMLSAGVLVHLGIDRSKGASVGTDSIPISHLTAAIDGRAGTILLRLVLMLFGYFGLILLGGAQNSGPFNAFLVGYSLDSFVGTFGSMMDQKAKARSAALAQFSAR